MFKTVNATQADKVKVVTYTSTFSDDEMRIELKLVTLPDGTFYILCSEGP